MTIDKYLADPTPLLPAPENVQSVQNVQNDDVQMYTRLYTEMYTQEDSKPAGKQPENASEGDVQIVNFYTCIFNMSRTLSIGNEGPRAISFALGQSISSATPVDSACRIDARLAV